MLEKKAHWGCGRYSEVNNFCADFGSISLSKGHGQGRFLRTPLKKNTNECRDSGNMSLPEKKFWSKSKEVRILIAVPLTMRRGYSAMKLGNWESLKE